VKEAVENIKSPELSLSTPSSELLNISPTYWLSLKGYDPIKVAQKLPQQFLILQGERDYQVTERDFERWHSLATIDNNRFTYKKYENLNHLMMDPPGIDRSKKSPEEYGVAFNVAEDVIKDIADWIHSK